MSKRNLVVLTGAGISAESGVPTFRAADGLWLGHRVEDVATPEAFQRDPALVQDFYNQRRRQLATVHPNAAHRALAELAARLLGGSGDLWTRVFANPVFHGAVLAAAVLQVVILIREWWSSGLWRRSSPMVEMFRPYGRIVVLHVTVLAAAWWLSETSAPAAAVLILCLMKAVVELVMTAVTSPATREA